jgi:Fur family zinc uptake transcriptional regulator
VLSS